MKRFYFQCRVLQRLHSIKYHDNNLSTDVQQNNENTENILSMDAIGLAGPSSTKCYLLCDWWISDLDAAIGGTDNQSRLIVFLGTLQMTCHEACTYNFIHAVSNKMNLPLLMRCKPKWPLFFTIKQSSIFVLKSTNYNRSLMLVPIFMSVHCKSSFVILKWRDHCRYMYIFLQKKLPIVSHQDYIRYHTNSPE